MKRSKSYNEKAAKIDKDSVYSPLDSVRLARETNPA